MPYSTPLKPIPVMPQPQGAFTDEAGRPTQYFYRYIADLNAWMKAVQAALVQLTPP